MKSFAKWATIGVAALVTYFFFDGLSEERKIGLSIIFIICGAAYSVMDYVNIKQLETMRKLESLQYKLDQIHGAIPDEYHIAEAVSNHLETRAKNAAREAALLVEVNTIVGRKI